MQCARAREVGWGSQVRSRVLRLLASMRVQEWEVLPLHELANGPVPKTRRGVQTLAHGVSHGAAVPNDFKPRRGDQKHRTGAARPPLPRNHPQRVRFYRPSGVLHEPGQSAVARVGKGFLTPTLSRRERESRITRNSSLEPDRPSRQIPFQQTLGPALRNPWCAFSFSPREKAGMRAACDSPHSTVHGPNAGKGVSSS